MERLRAKFSAFEYKGLAAITLVFAVITVILFLERSGIQYQYGQLSLSFMPNEATMPKAEALEQVPKDCLLLYSSEIVESQQALEEFEMILTDMKVGHDTVDIAKVDDYDFHDYTTAILLINNLSYLQDKLIELDTWVYNGGGAMFPMTIEKEAYFSVMEAKFGILESSYDNALVDSIYVTENFMVGGGKSFAITDSWDSALTVRLNSSDNVTVHAYTGDERQLPLIWESRYGSGKFVLDNFGLYTKEVRGLYAASYSLLNPVTVYPVINASCFYLLPAPVWRPCCGFSCSCPFCLSPGRCCQCRSLLW